MEKIVLKGEIEFADLRIYDKMISEPDVKFIDIKDFTVKENDDDEFDLCNYYEWNDNKPPVTFALFLCKPMSSSFVVENGLIMSPDKKTIYYGFDKEEIIIPKSVEIIAERAFYRNTVREIFFPKTLKRIEEFAFSVCNNLREIQLPDSVEFLGKSAFDCCNLDRIVLSKRLTTIPTTCFQYNNLDCLMIPSNIKKIEFGAFFCNCLSRVQLPEGVEEIEGMTFVNIDYISFPSTMRVISDWFYYEPQIDIEEDSLPYIDVDDKNPYFFSSNGTLYSRKNPEKPYLGFIYKNKKRQL